MGATEGDLQVGIDMDVILGNCTIPFVINIYTILSKKNQNAPRPSEHPPVRGKKCQNVYVGS